MTDGLVSSKCDHLCPHLLVIYQIVCSHGRAFVIKDLPWVGELVIGKSFFFRYFKIAKQYGTLTCEFILHMHRLGRFDHSQFGFLHKTKLQLKFDFRLILIQLRFIPIQLKFIRLFLSQSHRKCLAYVCCMICVKRLMKTTFKTSLI